MQIDIHKIAKLIDLVSHSDVSEINLKQGEEELRISRSSNLSQSMHVSAPIVAAQPIQAPVHVQAPAPAVEVKAVEAPKEQQTVGTNVMRSQMVGTFYRSSSPSAEPFVKEGDTVTEGQTVCIIEAMKMMNQIQADRSGTIKKILVENGTTVEFDQALFEFE